MPPSVHLLRVGWPRTAAVDAKAEAVYRLTGELGMNQNKTDRFAERIIL